MRFDGTWSVDEGGRILPVITAVMLDPNGVLQSVPFLIDTGADRTVLSYSVVASLGLELAEAEGLRLEGVWGVVASGVVNTTIFLTNTSGGLIAFKGEYAGLTDPAEDDISILGRDIFRQLGVIVDRPNHTVTLLAGRHRYVIQEA